MINRWLRAYERASYNAVRRILLLYSINILKNRCEPKSPPPPFPQYAISELLDACTLFGEVDNLWLRYSKCTTTLLLTSTLFWKISTALIGTYRRFGKAYRSNFQRSSSLGMLDPWRRTDRLSPNVATKYQSSPCNTQQSVDDVYTAPEACNHAQHCSSLPPWLLAKVLLFSELLCDSGTRVFFRVYASLLIGTPLTTPPVTTAQCYNNTTALYLSLNVCIVGVVRYYSLCV
jgi:hypothetical protein